METEKSISQLMSDAYASKDFDTYFQVQRHEMLSYIPQRAKRILDVGCASGTFGQLLKMERSVEVWGVEPNEIAAENAAQKLDKLICNVFESNIGLPVRHFDCIIFNDVLEHLVDPSVALLYAKQLLNDQGVVVASIPNVRYFDNIWNLLVNKDWQYTDQGILDKTHLRFFTYKSILSTFKNLNYQIEIIEGINPLEGFHPHHLRKYRFINWLMRGRIEDMRYLQFAVVANPKG